MSGGRAVRARAGAARQAEFRPLPHTTSTQRKSRKYAYFSNSLYRLSSASFSFLGSLFCMLMISEGLYSCG
jgi:hypothetical protein